MIIEGICDMLYYDFSKARKLILEHKGSAKKAYLGMAEDWGETSELAWDKEKKFGWSCWWCFSVAGIDSSSWATPTLRIQMEDGTFLEFQVDLELEDNEGEFYE